MGGRGEVVAVEAHDGRARGSRGELPRGWARQRARAARRRPADRGRAGVRPRAARPALLRPRHAPGAAGRALAQGPGADRAAWLRSRRSYSRRAAEQVRPGGVLVYSTCTISPRENEERMRRSSNQSDFKARDLSAEWPGYAQPPTALPAVPAPPPRHGRLLHRTAEARRMSGEHRTRSTNRRSAAARPARAAASRGCGRPTSRAATAASTACAATSCAPTARTAALTRRSRGCPTRRMSTCRNCGGSMLSAI